jgi:hypothetical protein
VSPEAGSGAATSPEPPPMIFNVGARRSGTYWLQRIVCAHPDVAEVPSETHLFSHGLVPLLERFQHRDASAPDVGFVYADRAAVIGHLRALCDTVFDHFREGRRVVSERTPLHVNHLPVIHEIYPDARIVHIIRDGRDVARSLSRQEWGPGSVADAAREWEGSVRSGRGAGLGEEIYREIRYERLLDDPGREIEALYAWLGLDPEAGLPPALDAARRRANIGPSSRGGVGVGKWRDEWEAADLAAFNEVAGPLLAELGYELEPAGTA